MKLKKGKYYIGDPCYVFDKSWERVLQETSYFEDPADDDSLFTIFGKKMVCGGTAYGDGEYLDNFGRKYAVDAGLIACMPVSLLKIDNKITVKQAEKDELLHIVFMEHDFECSVSNGIFQFGNIIINTEDQDDFDRDED